jgi:nitroreductase
MSFLDLVKKRYSVRKYKSTPVEKEKLDFVLEAARLAPTAANKQPIKLFVIRTKDHEKELSGVYNKAAFITAPIVILACTNPSTAWKRQDGKDYSDIDLAIALDHLILAATEVGLGTCWIGKFNPLLVKKTFNLPADLEPIMLVTVGYPDDSPTQKTRKPISELVSEL